VEIWFFVTGEVNAHGRVEWKRVFLHPRKAMRSVECSGNVVPGIRGGQSARWSGVENCFLLSAEDNAFGRVACKRGSFITEGNAIGGVVWKRISLYSQKAMRSVVWRGNVFPCIRGGQCARCCSVETWFLSTRRAIRSFE